MAEVEEHKKPKVVAKAQGEDDEPEHRTLRLTTSAKKQMGGFMQFVREQGVVGLAVGLTIGTAVTVFVKSIVDGIINPIIGAMMPGHTDLSSKYVCLHRVGAVCTNKLNWGTVLSNFISFVAIALVVYFAVKAFKLDKLDKKKEAK